MPIVKFIKNEKQNASAMKGSIDYCLQKYKTVDSQTGQRYVSGINCNGLNAYKEFMTTKLASNANDGRFFYQYIQSFSPKGICRESVAGTRGFSHNTLRQKSYTHAFHCQFS